MITQFIASLLMVAAINEYEYMDVGNMPDERLLLDRAIYDLHVCIYGEVW